MFEPDFVDEEERVPLIDQYENNDDSVYEDSQVETSFSQEDERQELNVEINALERGFNVKISPAERNRFRRSSGYLQVERNPGEFVNITKSNGELLAASTMRTRLGASLSRSLLGIETPSSVRSRSRVLIQEIPTELEMDDLSSKRLEEVISEVTREMSTNTDLDMREFLGIDKALTRIKGELENKAGKLTEIDKHIAREERKLAEIETSPDLREHEQRVKGIIAGLKEERGFKTGKFIQALKHVKVVPVFKNKGSPFEAGNYRPISLLSNVDKVLEKLVHKRMIKFLNRNNIIYNRQFGFRRKHSTVHGLVTLTEDIKK